MEGRVLREDITLLHVDGATLATTTIVTAAEVSIAFPSLDYDTTNLEDLRKSLRLALATVVGSVRAESAIIRFVRGSLIALVSFGVNATSVDLTAVTENIDSVTETALLLMVGSEEPTSSESPAAPSSGSSPMPIIAGTAVGALCVLLACVAGEYAVRMASWPYILCSVTAMRLMMAQRTAGP